MPLASTNPDPNPQTSQGTKRGAIPTNTNAISLLPNEILSMIMCEATHAQDSFRETYFYPLTLSLVCKLWHVVARGTPNIWRTILIDNLGTFAQVPARLKGSGNVPLMIKMDGVGLFFHNTTENIKYLAPQSGRWMTLEILFQGDLHPHIVSLPNRLPRLTALRIERRRHEPETGTLALNLSAPCLKTLHIVGLPIFWDPSTLIFSNLTHFTLSDCSVPFRLDRLLDHLQNSPHLASLELSYLTMKRTTDEEFESIMLRVILMPRLIELIFRACYLNDFCLLTTCLKTPNVKNLILSIMERSRPYSSSAFTYQRIQLEFPGLETLTIEFLLEHGEIELVHILRQLPPLLILRFDLRSEELEPLDFHFAALFCESTLGALSNLSILYSGGIPILSLLEGMLNLLNSSRRLPKVMIDRLDIEGIGLDGEDHQSTEALARLGELVVLEEWDEESRPSSWDQMLNECRT